MGRIDIKDNRKYKPVTFDKIRIGDTFITSTGDIKDSLYIKTHEYYPDEDLDTAINLISGDTYRYFYNDKVIPVDVEISFKERADVSS